MLRLCAGVTGLGIPSRPHASPLWLYSGRESGSTSQMSKLRSKQDRYLALQLGQELGSPHGALSLPRGHREPFSFHKEKLNRHTNKELQDGVSLTG